MTINMKEFLKVFNASYSYLYDNDLYGLMSNLLDKFYDLTYGGKFNDLLREFSDYRQDFVASDRECASFVLALMEYKLI